jgi:Cd2+/Zn2+-exporting ATPase
VVHLTLLVIACPGALVIATPVAVVAGIGRAAQRGILIKGGSSLERVGAVSALAFDKTGTLTEGRPRLMEIVAFAPALAGTGPEQRVASERGEAERDLLRWAAIAETGSEHPLARPILAAAEALGLVPQADSFTVHAGRGVTATYDRHIIVVGAPELIAAEQITVTPESEAALEELRARGQTALLVALDGLLLGALGVADGIRPGAPAVVERLRRLGIRQIEMLTGDNERTARAVARQVGLTTMTAGVVPEQKLERIRSLQQQGYVVAMVGDGINDAPALAAADVGVAMGAAGSGVAIETADVVLMGDDLARLPEAMGISRATLRVIRQNLALALLVVMTLLVGVLLGRVDMAGGMFVHEASVLAVILNGMRLLRA